MRRQYFYWSYLVLSLVLTIYGGYTLIYHFHHNNKLSILSLVFLIIGAIMLLIYLVLYLLSLKSKKKKSQVVAEVPVVEEKIEPVKEPEPVKEEKLVSSKPASRSNNVTYTRQSYSVYDSDDIYVKKVGYGPVLRVTGSRILDMRSNTYYRIQGNTVNQEGSGQVFEINGNSIRSVFGGYLYEISGSNINKVFGGFYASISGNYITLYDLIDKYEMTGSLNQKQLLIVAALLFGAY